MKLITTIRDNPSVIADKSWRNREGVRAVLFDKDNLVPIVFMSADNYHKIPGGGIEPNEDQIQALRREVLEEVGADIEILGEVGKIKEERFEWKYTQTSYCYFGKIISKKDHQAYTKAEQKTGAVLQWMSLDEAITALKADDTTDYHGKCCVKRDLAFLIEASKNN